MRPLAFIYLDAETPLSLRFFLLFLKKLQNNSNYFTKSTSKYL